jgi:2-polyprenyl-3-methyl-5-hydroxy-6-metoxy-1,4-benzoquinol methylase
MENREAKILESWQLNAENWIQTIENSEIESRQLVTNQAIIDAIGKQVAEKEMRIIDIGCGEGWLLKHLAGQGLKYLFGTDAIPELVETAKKGVPMANFAVCTYQEIAQGKLPFRGFDLVSCNFSLLGKEGTEDLIKFLPHLLNKNGKVLIQTLHPRMIKFENYVSGWMAGSWAGMKREFQMPYDWYFRTLEDWLLLFEEAKLKLIEMIAPIHPNTQQPASIIFIIADVSKVHQ